MKNLLIVESPAKIKTISKFLGNDFKIMSTVGHIKDLPPKKLGIELADPIKIEYTVLDGKGKTIADICKSARTANTVFLAPDPDREGEIIAWHIGQEIEKVIKDKNNIHRITFNEITKPAIEKSIENPTKINIDKVSAQQARRVLDRWVGYEVSPILWKKITKGLSAGRVQSVALRLVCEREEAIRGFKPEEYWSINGDFQTENSQKIVAALTHINKKKAVISNKEKADKILNELKTTSFNIDSIKDKKRLKNPMPPFMTSTLQQAAFNQLGFSVKKTMTIAQKLYEGVALEDPKTQVALITYMRTDSLRISDTAITQARKFIPQSFGSDYLSEKKINYEKNKKGKAKTQDAHEAIRPINLYISPDKIAPFVSSEIKKLYDLIWRRFIACQMKPALYAQRQVTIVGQKYTFGVTGSTLLFDGFLKVYKPSETEKEQKIVLPDSLKEKDSANLIKTDASQHFTQPPARYNEASLVKELEKQGIGRPSTYAATLNTIQTRKYTNLENKKFVPTELGFKVTELLVKNFPQIFDYKFTALMEQDLDLVEQGKMDRDELLNEFYTKFKSGLEKFKECSAHSSKKTLDVTNIACPKCKNGFLAIRVGKNGEFLGCTSFPECTFTSNFIRNEDHSIELVEPEKPKTLDILCPKCSSPLREIHGKFGTFVACSGFPKCKYIQETKASFDCPQCKGSVIKKQWRSGILWGCKNYPKCKFAIFGDIKDSKCPQCQNTYLIKKITKEKTSFVCPAKTCSHEETE